MEEAVISPMILTGFLIDEEEEKDIIEMGVKDSKLLYAKKRKKIADRLREKYTYHYEKAEPNEIDNFPNLNTLEAIKCGIVINFLMKNLNEKVKVFVDCPSVNTKAWGEQLMNNIVKRELVTLVCEHKADFKYPVVSAASIISKEIREELIQKSKNQFGIDFGSGYPADPKTKEFLIKTFGEKV